MKRWAIVEWITSEADANKIYSKWYADSDVRAAALLGVAKACSPLNFKARVSDVDCAFDVLREVWPDWDED